MRIFLLLATLSVVSGDNGCVKDSEVIAQIVHGAGNLLEQPQPSGEADENLLISIGFHVNAFNIVPHTSSLEIDGVVTRQWKHPSLYFSHLNPCRTVISITHLKHQLWVPSMAFVNAVSISLHQHSVAIRLKEDGTITHTERVTQNIPCKTEALHYPFGYTNCTLLWRNGDLTRNVAHIKWLDNTTEDVQEAGDLLLRSVSIVSNEVYLQQGVVDALSMVFEFSRGHHKILLLFYIPSIIFIIIPWLSLCLGPMAITRSVLIIGSLVLLMIHYSTNMAGLPQTNGITAIDVWKLFTFFFVLGILMELIIVTLMASLGRSRSCGRRSTRKGKYQMEPLYEELNDLRERKTRRTCGCCRISALLLDFSALWVSAAIFALFCLVLYTRGDVVIRWINDFDIETLRFI